MAIVKVKFLRSHPRYAYFKGDVGEMTAEAAADLLDKGFVIILPEASVKLIEDNPFPADYPAREILWAEGFRTIEQVKEAGESLMTIKGIKKKMFDLIMKYGS